MYKVYCDDTMICDSRIAELAINNPVIELELNTAGTFTFSFPPGHPYIDSINHLVSVVRVENNEEIVFQGFCSGESTDKLGNKYIECTGELAYLNDSVLDQYKWQEMSVAALLQAYINGLTVESVKVFKGHNDQVESRKQFTCNSNSHITVVDPNNSIYCYTNNNPTIQEIKEDLIDDLGGYIFVRYADGVKYIDYLAEPLVNATQTIELGKNLIDYQSNIDDMEIATRVIPLGKMLDDEDVPESERIVGLSTRLNIKRQATSTQDGISHVRGDNYLQNDNKISTFGKITKVVTWDDVTVASQLVTKGRKWLQDNQFQNVTINIKAIDLSLVDPNTTPWHLFDSIHVISEYHGMDRFFTLSKIVMNLNNPENNEYTLGSTFERSLTVQTNSALSGVTSNREELSESEQAWLKEAQDRATAIIGGSKGGIVITEFNENGQPCELKIQNALTNPSKIWRWNIGGFAYSSNGGQSWGDAAITMNGEIVANFITTGVMSAARVKTGILTDTAGKFSLNMETGALTMKGGTFDGGEIKVGTPVGGVYPFQVSSAGKVDASNLNITGGGINLGNGVFTVNNAGAVTASNLTITGGTINIANTDFLVRSDGSAVAKDLTITGGGIRLGTQNPQTGKYQFDVTNTGSLTANDANITGGTIKVGTKFDVAADGSLTAHDAKLWNIYAHEGITLRNDIYGTPYIDFLRNYSSRDFDARITMEAVDEIYFYAHKDAGASSPSGRATTYAGTVHATNWVTDSSRKIKDNIEDISDSLVDALLKLRPVEYDSKITGKHNMGLIAEEVLEEIPDIVDVPEDYDENKEWEVLDKVPSIEYLQLIAPLIKLVQKQEKRIAELERRLNDG